MKKWIVMAALSLAAVGFSEESDKANIQTKLKHLTEQKDQLTQMMEDLSAQADISTDEKEALNEEFLKTQKELDASITELKKTEA